MQPDHEQFLWGAFLVIALGLTATGLYFNETWKSISSRGYRRGGNAVKPRVVMRMYARAMRGGRVALFRQHWNHLRFPADHTRQLWMRPKAALHWRGVGPSRYR